MTIKEVYKKYKHLDQNLSDREMLPVSFYGSILLDLWAAVKEATKIGKEKRDDAGDKLSCGD